jgi:hypothetical protein
VLRWGSAPYGRDDQLPEPITSFYEGTLGSGLAAA